MKHLSQTNTYIQDPIAVLFERYYRPMVVFCNVIVGDMQTSQDIVQDVFVKIIEKNNISTIQPSAIATYLFRSVRNAVLNYMNKKKIPVSTILLDHIEIKEELCAELDLEMEQIVSEQLALLPTRTKETIEQIVINGNSYKIVAENMSISVNTVKSNLREGMIKLRQKLLTVKSK